MKLLTKHHIGMLELKNRVVMAPMCMYVATEDGLSTPFHIVHYSTRAYGGVGLIIQEATAVEARGRISGNDLGIWSDEHIHGLKQIVDGVHLADSKIGIQLAHAGRKCLAKAEKILAPSEIAFNSKYPVPSEMSKDDIHTVIKAFGEAAVRAKKAGYDLVEIHGAHGYLINQFLSPLVNQRDDEYGIDKSRFLFEVITEVKKYWTGPISLRLSAEEYAEEGNHILDTLKLVKKLHGLVDVIHVSSGGVVPVSFNVFPGYQLEFAKAVKEQGFTVIGGGLLTHIEEMETAILDGSVDFVFLGRELLRNPYFVMNTAKSQDQMDWIIKPYERGYL